MCMTKWRQPWDDEQDKLNAQAKVIAAAVSDVIAYVTGPALTEVSPGTNRDMLGDLAYRIRRWTNEGGGQYLPMKQRQWIVGRLTEATKDLPWKDD